MFANRDGARTGGKRILAIVCLLLTLAGALTACRGFFGQAPIALLVVDQGNDQEVPVMVTFDLSGSNDPDGTIASYELEFGDGSAARTGTDVSVAVTHEYDTAGTYTILLTITDNDGRIGMTNAVVTIGPVMITFAADRVGDFDIYRMQADGTDQAVVYNTDDEELFPDLVRITRDKIAYAAEDGTNWDIWIMDTDGGGRSQLTTPTNDSNQIQPSWSRTGTRIAYASNATQTPSATTWEIYTMTSAGAAVTQLTSQSPSWAIAPAYSPVNDDILFVSDKTATGGSAIWLWDDSLGAAIELYDSTGRDGDASPALVGLATALNLPVSAGISRPCWSPDGEKIVFSRERTAGGIVDVYVMDADGTNAETLEEYVDSLGVTNTDITTDDDEFCPFWLEDESGIAFVRDDGAEYHIYTVSFATGAVTELTETGDNVSPASKR